MQRHHQNEKQAHHPVQKLTAKELASISRGSKCYFSRAEYFPEYELTCLNWSLSSFRVGDLRAELPYSAESCSQWFDEYAGMLIMVTVLGVLYYNVPAHDDCIGPDGMIRLCADLKLDPEDLIMLALAWKLKAVHMGFFSRTEWLSGMHELQSVDCHIVPDYLFTHACCV